MAVQFAGPMATVAAALGGGVPQLSFVNVVGARVRLFACPIVLAAQPIGTQIVIARVPAYASLIGVDMMTDTSLATATLSLGNINDATLYGPAVTDTTLNQWVNLLSADAILAPLAPNGTQCWDSVTASASQDHEDLVLTVAALALPAAGNLFLRALYALD